MNAVNTALYGTLAADSTLTALLYSATSIYNLQAKDGSNFAYVVFNKMSDAEPNDSPHRIVDMIYQVRAFTKQSAQAAEAIDARCQTLLHGAALTVSGGALLRINRIGGFADAFSEPNTDTVYSVSSLYRIRVERTS
jgi:hypothetical protein